MAASSSNQINREYDSEKINHVEKGKIIIPLNWILIKQKGTNYYDIYDSTNAFIITSERKPSRYRKITIGE